MEWAGQPSPLHYELVLHEEMTLLKDVRPSVH